MPGLPVQENHFFSYKKQLVLLLAVAFIVKFLGAIYIRYLISCQFFGYHLDEMVIWGDDYKSYHAAIENYIQTGTYFFFNGRENVFASRLPHFSIPYFIFRQFLNIAYANFLVMVLQIVVECIAIITLATLAFRLTGSRLAFYLTYGLYLVSFHTSYYNNFVLPDSLSVSFLILFLYQFHTYVRHPSTTGLFKTGLLLGILVVFKPYFSLLFLPIGLYFFFIQKNIFSAAGLGTVTRKTVIISLPLILLLTPWVIRNYDVYNKFIPFQVNMTAGYNYTLADQAIRRYLQSFGEDFLSWDNRSAGYFFKPNDLSQLEYSFPEYAFTSDFKYQDLTRLRNAYLESKKNFSDSLDARVAASFDSLTADYIREKPFRYYAISPFVSLKTFALNSGVQHLPLSGNASCHRPFHRFIYYQQAVLYWCALVPGLIGLFLLYRKNKLHFMFLFIPLFLLVFFPLSFRWIEKRYFIHSYPVLLLGLVYFVIELRRKYLQK